MNLWQMILEALPDSEADAINSTDVFEKGKGMEDRSKVSIALSQMYARGLVDRKNDQVNNRSNFKYWKKPADEKPAEAVTTDQVEQIKQDAKQEFEIPEFLRKSSQEPLAKAYVAVPQAEQQPEEQKPEPQPAKLITEAVSHQVRISMALEIILAALPESSGIIIDKEAGITLHLDAGAMKFKGIKTTDVELALDAYATLQSFRACK